MVSSGSPAGVILRPTPMEGTSEYSAGMFGRTPEYSSPVTMGTSPTLSSPGMNA